MMATCRDVSALLSLGLERRLSWWQRFGLRLHLMICRSCTRFRQNILFLREALRLYAEGRPAETRLSPEARARIKGALRDSLS